MEIISRKGSLVVLKDKKGRFWLTRRKKPKHDSRRKKFGRVYFLPITQIQEKELHLFVKGRQ